MSSLTKSRNNNKKNKNKARSPEALFNEALERYQRFKTKNDKFEQEMLALIERVSAQIESSETHKYHQLQSLTLKLIPFFSKKSLPEYLREELFDWIEDNLHQLSNNPYSHHLPLKEVETAFDKHRHQHLTHHHEKVLKKLTKDGVDPEEIEQLRQLNERAQQAKTPEELEQILNEALKEAIESEGEEYDDDFLDSLFEDDAQLDSDFDEFLFDDSDSDHHKPLDNLFKQSSINKLFRRIAKVIHPDLEQDEEQKKCKHQQMSKLIDARDNKDIAYILSTYKETFGELPDTFPAEDYTNLTLILHHMTNQLSQQKHETLDRIPFAHIYHDLFYHNKPQQEAAAIRKHIKMQKEAANEYSKIGTELTSIAKLKEFLTLRMQVLYDELENEFGDDIPF